MSRSIVDCLLGEAEAAAAAAVVEGETLRGGAGAGETEGTWRGAGVLGILLTAVSRELLAREKPLGGGAGGSTACGAPGGASGGGLPCGGG
mmetsp:Transcript_13569/g.47162  ORF Transcript_13569/g.47162 Transcript_13569/m.47162 type:complete len:91 (+) Transcript_13569:269-541(+)